MNWKESFDFTGKKQNHNYTKHYLNNYDKDRSDGFTCNHPSKIHYAVFILKKLWSNKKIRIFLILSLVLLKVLFIFILALVIPAIIDFTDNIRTEGMRGIFESVMGFLVRIWNGA
jgi:hypothetical protein